MDKKTLIDLLRTAYNNGYRYFGVRGVHEKVVVGQRLAPSYDWDFENDCSSDVELPGTCAVDFELEAIFLHDDDYDNETFINFEKAYARARDYYGVQTVIIASRYDCDYGYDLDEVILGDAVCLAILDEE